MVEETKAFDTNTKTQLSLAAALFFSPLVQNILQKNNRDISDSDKAFIRGYIKFGYITLLFGLITVTAGILNYLFVTKLLSVTYTVSIFILITLLIISVVSILSDISLMKWTGWTTEEYTIEGNKKDILLKYLPIYNIHLWYNIHSFENPNRWIKESLLRRIIFMIGCMSGNIMICTTILIIIILRVASLMSDIDVFTITIKQRLNILFTKNPEELRWYITWLITYLGKTIGRLFFNGDEYTLSGDIAKEKEVYSRIIDIHNNTLLIIEYILGIGIIILLSYLLKPDFTVWTYYVWLGLISTRYLIMAIQLKHLPHLPIARELLLLGKAIGSFFAKKTVLSHQ